MVGYTESLTDPSYEGQILILTYPLVGNYGVPSRFHDLLEAVPAHFESSRIHVAALVVGYYSEDFSHFLAHSSLGTWLKENDVPALCGVDTRALTKRIRAKGVMLGRLLARKPEAPVGRTRDLNPESPTSLRVPLSPGLGGPPAPWREDYIDIPYHDHNTDNLVVIICPSSHGGPTPFFI